MYSKRDIPPETSFNPCTKSAGVLEIQRPLAGFGCEDILCKYSILLNFTIFAVSFSWPCLLASAVESEKSLIRNPTLL